MEIAFLPRCVLARLTSRPQHLNLMLSALLVAVGLPFFRFVPHLCLMRTLFGKPCPGCGITSSLRALEAGHLHTAWQANPAGLLLALGLLFHLMARPFALALPENAGVRIDRWSKHLSRLSYAALGVVWLERLL